MKIKKILASVLGLALTASVLAGCSSGNGSTAESGSSGSGSGSASGDLIKVGIINNDPNESGYRTANDKDMKATFTEENGYDASFAYSLKNDEQIAAAQTFIQSEVDYLLISAAGTSGWDSVLKDAQAQGIKLSCSTEPSTLTKACTRLPSYPTWPRKVRPQLTGWLPRDFRSTT